MGIWAFTAAASAGAAIYDWLLGNNYVGTHIVPAVRRLTQAFTRASTPVPTDGPRPDAPPDSPPPEGAGGFWQLISDGKYAAFTCAIAFGILGYFTSGWTRALGWGGMGITAAVTINSLYRMYAGESLDQAIGRLAGTLTGPRASGVPTDEPEPS